MWSVWREVLSKRVSLVPFPSMNTVCVCLKLWGLRGKKSKNRAELSLMISFILNFFPLFLKNWKNKKQSTQHTYEPSQEMWDPVACTALQTHWYDPRERPLTELQAVMAWEGAALNAGGQGGQGGSLSSRAPVIKLQLCFLQTLIPDRGPTALLPILSESLKPLRSGGGRVS